MHIQNHELARLIAAERSREIERRFRLRWEPRPKRKLRHPIRRAVGRGFIRIGVTLATGRLRPIA